MSIRLGKLRKKRGAQFQSKKKNMQDPKLELDRIESQVEVLAALARLRPLGLDEGKELMRLTTRMKHLRKKCEKHRLSISSGPNMDDHRKPS